MARQFGHLRQRRVLPHENLILRVSVRRHQFRWMLRPRQIAYLRPGVHTLHRLSGQCVPKANASIGSASAAGQQSMMMWWPGDCFHSGHVLQIRLDRTEWMLIPHIQAIVVTATGKILIVGRPFQTAHLLTMTGQTAFRHQRWCSCVSLHNQSISRPAR